MRNTGIEYSSTEHTPTVREDFANLLPPLSDEQLSLLEGDILRNGCYPPIIVNEAHMIVDGHNRAAICYKHGIPYRMAVFFFKMTWKPNNGRWIPKSPEGISLSMNCVKSLSNCGPRWRHGPCGAVQTMVGIR